MGSYYAGMIGYYGGELRHHGIQGQKWGVKNGPPYPIQSERASNPNVPLMKKNLKGARTANLEQWGKDAEHNVLYIAGYSGSGKSTTALGLKGKNDSVIHLDGYVEPEDDPGIHSKAFDHYLDEHVPEWRELHLSAAGKSKVKHFSKEYWNIADDFISAIDSFGISEFKKGNRVICEGVQIADDWFGDKKKLKGKPLIVLNTNALVAMSRAGARDGRKPLLQDLISLDDPKDYLKWYFSTFKNLNDLSKATDATRQKKLVRELLEQYK